MIPNKIPTDYIKAIIAVHPQSKEKHFMVTSIEFDEEGRVIECIIEAVMTKREIEINWRDLKNPKVWKMGWK